MLIQAGQSLTGLEAFLDRPPAAGHPGKDGQRDRAGSVAAVEGQFAGTPVTADQQPVAARPSGVDLDERPVVEAVSFGARACR